MVKVDHSTFLRIVFEDVTSDVDLSWNDSLSTHLNGKMNVKNLFSTVKLRRDS